jgi:polyisoprenyl-phosphate glycosyltransferase
MTYRQIERVFISIIIPVFNEQENISVLNEKLDGIFSEYENYETIFVDDGSDDNTLSKIVDLSEKYDKIKYISLSRNFGHQYALKAGIDHAIGDCVITMDADMQHPPEYINKLIKKWQEGYEIVYTVREESETLPFFKKVSSKLFYKFINLISDINMKKGAADFRLMDRTVVEALKEMNEYHIFMRGMVAWLGFKECSITYTPNDRIYGQTKYSYKKMFRFALDGITSFSVRPLYLSTFLGLTISTGAFAYGIFAISARFLMGKEISGWASIIISILFLGGIQLLMLGVIGEYLGKMFMESKKRPKYVIRKKKL